MHCSRRTTFELHLDHLVLGTDLADLCAISGLAEVGSLLRYSRHVAGAPQSKAALRAALARSDERASSR